jgi:hypothetical protein
VYFYSLSDTRVTSNKHVVQCTSKFYKLSESTGGDWNIPILIVVVVCRRT